MDRLESASTSTTQQLWAWCISGLVNWTVASDVNAVLETCDRQPILAKELAYWVNTVELDSDYARQLKKQHDEQQAQRETWTRSRVKPTIRPIAQELENFESSGQWHYWWNSLVALKYDETKEQHGELYAADLSSTQGWIGADTATRERLLAAAVRYVTEQAAQPDSWLGTGDLYYSDMAAFKSFHLLWHENPEALERLPDDVWRRWLPIIIAYPISTSSVEEATQRELLRVASVRAPEELCRVVLLLIDIENEQPGSLSVTRKLTLCWKGPLGVALLEKCRDQNLTEATFGYLLEGLVEHGVSGATDLAISNLASPANGGGAEERRLIAARILLGYATADGWPHIWTKVQQEPQFGHMLFEGVAHGAHWGGAKLQQLTEDQLADLYFWLARQYPHAEDPDIESMHAVSPRESVGRWRDSVLDHLKERGTPHAVSAIARLVQQLPEVIWLKRSLLIAQGITRQRTWMPPSPEDIIALAADRRRRFVQNGQQLLDVLIESLEQLQTKLHGETPAIFGIWNEWRRDNKIVYQPKKEELFSDFVKLHLDEDLAKRGIVVNREVQIRRSMGGVSGEETDIHVDAIRRDGPHDDSSDSLTVIIEVKGNWHGEIWTAMETQLAGRYLHENQTRYGVYLVGWFTCPQWDREDNRQKSLPKESLVEARQRLDEQAASLSEGGREIIAVVLDTALR